MFKEIGRWLRNFFSFSWLFRSDAQQIAREKVEAEKRNREKETALMLANALKDHIITLQKHLQQLQGMSESLFFQALLKPESVNLEAELLYGRHKQIKIIKDTLEWHQERQRMLAQKERYAESMHCYFGKPQENEEKFYDIDLKDSSSGRENAEGGTKGSGITRPAKQAEASINDIVSLKSRECIRS